MTLQSFLESLPALIIAIFAAYKGIVATVKADANTTAHAANKSEIAVVAQNVLDITKALPNAAQQVAAPLQATLATIPQAAHVEAAIAPVLQQVTALATAVQGVSNQIAAMSIPPNPPSGNPPPSPLIAGLKGAAT